jgi:hypothetical protein
MFLASEDIIVYPDVECDIGLNRFLFFVEIYQI